MRIIIPMAGMGKRMRPHTLTVPKPLLPIAGKPIVQRLVMDIAEICNEEITEIGFVIGNFGKSVEQQLMDIANSVNAKGKIYYQEEALGTAHAVFCAEELLEEKVIVAFADTLFKADMDLDQNADGVVWVQKVEDPRQFGVVKMDDAGVINEFVEKPEQFVSDLAIIGIYYFKEAQKIREEIKYLLDNDIRDKGEYQLTDALKNMMLKGNKILPGKVDEWLDCGNKNITVKTNSRYLSFLMERNENLVSPSAKLINSILIEPVYLGEGVVVENSVLGPNVSVSEGTHLNRSNVSNSIIGSASSISGVYLDNSMIGSHVTMNGRAKDVSIGDYNTIED